MSRRRLVVLSSAIALLAMGLVVVLLVVGLTQTDYGRARIRDLVHEQLTSRVQGKLHVGRLSGGFFTGVTIDSLEIRDAQDSLFVASGPITVEYDPRDILDQRLLLRHVHVARPVVRLEEHDDGVWNFRRIFPAGPRQPPRQRQRGFGDFIVIDSATVVGGRVQLTKPWRPSDTLRGPVLDSVIAHNLARADAVIREAGEGYTRTWRWEEIDWASSGVRLADPDSIGRRFGIARLSMVEQDPPFRFRDVRGAIRLHHDSLWLDIDHFDLPGSTGRAEGKLVWGGGIPMRYDIRVVGDSVSMADVAWVYPTLPRTGSGSMALHIRNDSTNLRVLEYAISDMDVRSTGSRLRGNMTYGVGGPLLIVKDVDLRADPVDFDLLRTLAGGPFSYDWQGTITGTVRGRGGPLDRFRVDSAAVVFRDANVPGAVTRGSGRGVLDIRQPALAAFRGFAVSVDQLDLRTLQFLNPEFPRLNGMVAGRAVLDSVWTDVRFRDGDMTHRDGAADPSRFTGSGRVTLTDELVRYDVDLEAQPISFTALAQSYPVVPLRGSYAGPLRVRGGMDDLELVTRLTGPAGALAVDGRFALLGPRYGGVGTLSASRLDVSALLNRLDVPPTDLTLESRFDLAGTGIADLLGTLAVDVDRSLVDSVRIYPSLGRFTLGEGRARVDTLRLETTAAALSATGGLGLVAGQADTLEFTVTVDSLGGLRRYLAAETDAGAAVTDSLTGFMRLRGTLFGSAEGIDVAGTANGHSLSVRGMTADTLSGDFALTDVLANPRGRIRIGLDTVLAAGVRLSAVELAADVLGASSARVRLGARSRTGPTFAAVADVTVDSVASVVAVDSAQLDVGDNRWSLAAPARIVTDRAGVLMDTLELRGSAGGRLRLGGRVPVVDSIAFALRGDSVPLRDLGLLAQTTSSLDGSAGLVLDVRGTRTAPVLSFGGALAGAQFGDVRLARVSLGGGYAEQRLQAELALSRGDSVLLRAEGELPVDLAIAPRARRLLDRPIRGNIRSERVDLSVLEAFTTAVREASGTFVANLDVGGRVDEPRLTGGLQVTNGALALPNLGSVRLRNVQADIGFLGDSLQVRRLQASSGDSRRSLLTLGGSVALADYANPGFDLTLFARDFEAIAKPRVATLVVSTEPNLRLTGRLTGSTLTGGVRVEEGEIYLPEFSSKDVIDLDDLEFFNVVDTTVFANRVLLPSAPPTLVRNLTLQNVGIAMGDEVWLSGPEARINLGGRVNLTTARDLRGREPGDTELALDGILTANRGTYRLNLGVVQRTFEIERGELRFFGEPDLNPTLDIVAVYTVRQFSRQAARQDVQVRATIGGTLVQPQLQLGASAGGENGLALSESDAVSYLVTGAPAFAVGGGAADQLTAARIAVGSLGSYLGSRATGGLFDVVQFQTPVLDEAAASGGLRNAGVGLLAGTRLDLGRQIGSRAFVSANAGLCQVGDVLRGGAFNATDFAESIGIKVDYRLGGGLGLSAGVEPPTASRACTQNVSIRGFAPTPRQWTFDLFRTWRF